MSRGRGGLTCTRGEHTLGTGSGTAGSTAALCRHYSQLLDPLGTKMCREVTDDMSASVERRIYDKPG